MFFVLSVHLTHIFGEKDDEERVTWGWQDDRIWCLNKKIMYEIILYTFIYIFPKQIMDSDLI